jgi:hypothetical protein
MNIKTCTTCKNDKILNEFHKYKNSKDGLTHRCKLCVSRKKTISKDIKICSLCKISKSLEDFHNRKNGRLGKSSICKMCRNENLKNYRKNNIVRIRKVRNIWRNEKRKNDPLYKLECNVRCRIYDFLKGRDIQKNNKTFEIVGCTPKELKKYIEEKFTEGMNWKNYGYYGWHIDHIIPLDNGKNEDEIYKLCHYSNLQPLWKDDNFKKGKKIIDQ